MIGNQAVGIAPVDMLVELATSGLADPDHTATLTLEQRTFPSLVSIGAKDTRHLVLRLRYWLWMVWTIKRTLPDLISFHFIFMAVVPQYRLM